MTAEAGDSPFSGPYRLALLGRVGLTDVRGEEVSLPRGKPMAMLIFLAFQEEGVHRDELAALLWGNKELSRGRQSVRQALSQIRKDLGPEVFYSEDPVELAPGVLRTDLEELREAVGEGNLSGAEEIWRGEPLSGLAVGEEAWDRWAEELASTAKRILVVGMEEVALRRVGEGDVDGAVEELRRATNLAPDRVESWFHLIEVQIDFGRVRGARTSLAEAWGHLDPGVYEDRLGPLERRVSMGPDPGLVGGEGMIVGRESDLAAAAGAWRSAKEGRTELLVFEGGEGFGKTRLLDEVAKPMVTPGARVARETGAGRDPWAAAGRWARALGAMRGAEKVLPETAAVLASFLDLDVGEEAGKRRGEDGNGGHPPQLRPPQLRPPVSEGALADAFLDLLASAALDHPLLFTIDNLESTDPESWRLLRRVVRLRPGVPLLICMGWDSSAAGEEQRRDVVDWTNASRVTLRRLRPFTQDEVESLIRLKGWKHDGAVAEAGHQVFERTAGHPELVFGFLKVLEENRLRPSPLADGPPQIPDLDTLPLSGPLQEHFRKKIDDLPDAAHHLIRVLGETDHATIRTLEYSSGLGVGEIQELIMELKDRGLVEEKEEGVGLVNRAMADLAREAAPVPSVIGAPMEEPHLPPYLPPEESALADLAFRRVLVTWTGSAAVIAVVLLIVWVLFLR